MRSLRILPVGNGACSVIRDSAFSESVPSVESLSIIDCGRGSRGGRTAARILEEELSVRDWGSLQSVVITHWDADHWNGLRHIADNWPRPASAKKRSIVLYSPAIPFNFPPRLAAGIHALISATSNSGIEAIDLVDAWRQHFDVIRKPVARGDTILLAGRKHRVEWPPRILVGTVVEKAASILEQIERIAEENPRFRELLRDAYSSFEGSPFETATEGCDDYLDQGRGATSDDLYEELELPESMIIPDEEDHDDAQVTDSSSSALAEESSHEKIRQDPVLDKEIHGSLIRAARNLQNDLSLVFHDAEWQTLIVYGDAPPGVVKALAPGLHRMYQVQLAPHHGTHPMPFNAPRSWTCVAQCSQKQKAAWETHSRMTVNDVAIVDHEPLGIQLSLDWRWCR